MWNWLLSNRIYMYIGWICICLFGSVKFKFITFDCPSDSYLFLVQCSVQNKCIHSCISIGDVVT